MKEGGKKTFKKKNIEHILGKQWGRPNKKNIGHISGKVNEGDKIKKNWPIKKKS